MGVYTQEIRSNLDRLQGRRSALQSSLRQCQQEISRLENEEALLDLVVGLIQQLIDQEVKIGVQAVEQLQTEGLQAIFTDQDLRVRSEVDIQRGKVAVDLVTIQRHADGHEVDGVSGDSFGGAVTTVQSVLLRVIIILRRGLRPVLFLDETLPAFDHNYVINAGRFLSTLCARLDTDILLITHNPALVEAADHAYRAVPPRNGGGIRLEATR